LRLLRRDPVLLSQIGLQLVYLLPLAFILIQPAQGIDLGRYADTAFAPALTILSSTLAGSLIWITVSAEDAPDLIAAAPVSRRLVDRAKLVAAVGPVLALMAIPVALLLLRSPVAGAWAAVGCVAAGTSAGLIGVWRKNPGSRKAFNPPWRRGWARWWSPWGGRARRASAPTVCPGSRSFRPYSRRLYLRLCKDRRLHCRENLNRQKSATHTVIPHPVNRPPSFTIRRSRADTLMSGTSFDTRSQTSRTRSSPTWSPRNIGPPLSAGQP